MFMMLLFIPVLITAQAAATQTAEDYFGMARKAENRLQFDEAIGYYEKAAELWGGQGNLFFEGLVYITIGKLHHACGRLERAGDAFNRALAVSHRLQNDELSLACLYNLGEVHKDLGAFRKALDFYEQALLIAEKLGSSDSITSILSNQAEIHHLIGNYDKALPLFEMALEMTAETAHAENTAAVLSNMGAVYLSMRRYREAVRLFSEALELDEGRGDAAAAAVRLNNLGTVCHWWGRYDEAVEYFERALARVEEQGGSETEAGILNNIGAVYQDWGMCDDAVAWFERSREVNERIGLWRGVAVNLSNIGTAYMAAGRYQEALDNYSRALETAERYGGTSMVLGIMTNSGQAHRALRQYDQAMACYTRAVAVARELDDKVSMAAIISGVGDMYTDWIAADRSEHAPYEEALEYYHTALSLYEELGHRAETASSLRNLGYVHHLRGRYDQANEYFSRSIELLEQLRVTARGGARRDYLSAQLSTYRLLASSCIRSGLPARAFDAVEAASARYLAEQLHERLDSEDSSAAEIEQVRAKIAGNAAVLRFVVPKWGDTVLRLFAAQSGLRAEEKDCGAFVSDAAGAYGRRISRDLRKRERDARSLKPEEIGFEQIVEYYLSLLSSPRQNRAEREAAGELARGLYDVLFSGLEDQMEGREELLIIPDGILTFLPFEALVMPDGRYLVEQYHIRYAPSLTVMQILEHRAYGDRDRRPLLALGGAVYEETGYQAAVVKSEKQLEALRESTVAALSRGMTAGDAYQRLGYGRWANLPGTLAEVRRIAELVPGSVTYTGSTVDEAFVKELDRQEELRRYRVIHFATHGLVVPEFPELSALVLSQVQDRDDGEDGYLRMEEIASLSLEADFVNLSACETGLGKIYGGEGVVGLTQSFLLAGANGLCVSLWQVEDTSTMDFMTGLYSLVQVEDMSYARAVTEMKRRFIASERSSPLFWAPFVYYGKE